MKTLFSAVIVFFLFMSSMLLDWANAFGTKLPADTNSITSLTPEEAKALVQGVEGESLGLASVTALDVATAKAIASFKGELLDLNGLATLDPATAKALTAFGGDYLIVSGLAGEDAETAKVLAGFDGQGLYVSGESALDAVVAKSLADFDGQELHLPSVASFDNAAARTLVNFKTEVLYLPALTDLDSTAAKALADFKGEEVVLAGLTSLESSDSVDIARVLATCDGRISLPNLKRVSPKTLRALIEKKDVVLPRIETLEFIDEPDGSPTTAFVAPEWLRRRQEG